MGGRRCALPLWGLGCQGTLSSQEEKAVPSSTAFSMYRTMSVKVNAAMQQCSNARKTGQPDFTAVNLPRGGDHFHIS